MEAEVYQEKEKRKLGEAAYKGREKEGKAREGIKKCRNIIISVELYEYSLQIQDIKMKIFFVFMLRLIRVLLSLPSSFICCFYL